jgi:hypothetical protein
MNRWRVRERIGEVRKRTDVPLQILLKSVRLPLQAYKNKKKGESGEVKTKGIRGMGIRCAHAQGRVC